MLVEMHPELAPQAVERVKRLAREGVYDGLQFHRVIDLFVAQTGNPNNKDGGTSQYPNLPPEFSARIPDGTPLTLVSSSADANTGFLGTLPVQTASNTETKRRAVPNVQVWGAYCPGVAGMGRGEAPDSANSEIFFMRGASSRRLDLQYTVWGNTVIGQEVIGALNVGEPPASPDIMRKVRVAADLPEAERPVVEAMDTTSPAFQAMINAARASKGADFTICDLQVPTRLR